MHFLYLDDKTSATTASGILVDAAGSPPHRAAIADERTRSYALTQARQSWAGDAARDDEITATGNQIKPRLDNARHGLSDDASNRIGRGQLADMGVTLRARARFTAFGDLRSDSQLGLPSMGWAMGPMFDLPEAQVVVVAGGGGGAARCGFKPDVNRITSRCDRDRTRFSNAAAAVANSVGPGVAVCPETA